MPARFAQDLLLEKEIAFRVRSGLSKLRRDYSFARKKGFEELETLLMDIVSGHSSTLDIFVSLQNISEYDVFGCSLDVLMKWSSAENLNEASLGHMDKQELILALGILQALCFVAPQNTARKLVSRPDNLAMLIHTLQRNDADVLSTTLETIQCILSIGDPAIVKLFEESNGVRAVADLLRQRETEQITCIECLFVYLSPEKPSNFTEVALQDWAVGRDRRRKFLESVVGENFVKQLLCTVGIGTIRIPSSTSKVIDTSDNIVV